MLNTDITTRYADGLDGAAGPSGGPGAGGGGGDRADAAGLRRGGLPRGTRGAAHGVLRPGVDGRAVLLGRRSCWSARGRSPASWPRRSTAPCTDESVPPLVATLTERVGRRAVERLADGRLGDLRDAARRPVPGQHCRGPHLGGHDVTAAVPAPGGVPEHAAGTAARGTTRRQPTRRAPPGGRRAAPLAPDRVALLPPRVGAGTRAARSRGPARSPTCARATRVGDQDVVPQPAELVDGRAGPRLDHQLRAGLARVERGRERGGVPGGRVDGGLQVHPVHGVVEEEDELPLVLLVTHRACRRTAASRPGSRTTVTAWCVVACRARACWAALPRARTSAPASQGRTRASAMVGELCNHPPDGVAEMTFPHRSATSMWQVSPRVVPPRTDERLAVPKTAGEPFASRRSPGEPPPSVGSPIPNPTGAVPPSSTYFGSRPSPLRSDGPASAPTSFSPLGRVARVKQGGEVGAVAVVGVPVGEGQLRDLHRRGGSASAVAGSGSVAECLQHGELLQQRRPLAPRADLVHLPPEHVKAHGGLVGWLARKPGRRR